MGARSVLVCTHGHCFDGLASAALFTRLHRELGGRPAEYRYRSCGYGPGMAQIPTRWLKADENAILDFRFTESPKLTWYFDHHGTAFGSDDERDRALARAGAGEPRWFWEPTYGSCAKLVSDVAARTFDLRLDERGELVTWADRIDAARFASAEEATSVTEPAMRLAAVTEHHGDGPFLETMVPRMLERPLEDLARSPDVADRWARIAAGREAYTALVRERGRVHGDVVLVDLGDRQLDAAAKFVTYALFPRCTYSVAVVRSQNVTKVGVGYNPWSESPRRHDIAAMCKREGGGGHPVVGAVSLGLDELDRARAIAARFVAELAGPGPITAGEVTASEVPASEASGARRAEADA